MPKFNIEKTSDPYYTEIKEINTIEELMDFVDKNGDIVIRDNPFGPYRVIEIYDTWRE